MAPHHYALGSSGAFTVGLGLTAYTLGLRHAFDADHIAAIDNTTRKLMAERQRPLSVGFWFSLGHSTIVFALALAFALGIRALSGAVRWSHSAGGRIDGSATVLGNVVYFSDLGANTSTGLDLRTGRRVFSFPDGEFTPVITDGKVVFLIGYSKIYQMLPKR